MWSDEDRRQIGGVEEVTALLWRYTWSFDLNDQEQNKECFADDVEVAITLEQTVRYFGRDNWIAADFAGRNRQMVTLHYVSNVIITKSYDPDLAELKAYVMTRRTAPGEPGAVLVAGGHYTGTARRINGQWKFVVFGFQRSHGAFS